MDLKNQIRVIDPPPLLNPNGNTSSEESPGVVLLVDDSEFQLVNISKHLKKSGYKVIEALEGKKALELVREVEPDLVISDYMMPEFNGVDLGRAIKSDPALSHIYFILLTANNREDDRYRALKSFADDYLQKPISPPELLAKVSSFMRLARLQKELRKRNKQLEKTIKELERTNHELKNTQAQMLQQEKMASIGLLAAGVAHEINNPICYVDMNLGMLNEHIQSIEQVVNSANRLAQNVLEKSRDDALKEAAKAFMEQVEKEDISYVLDDMKNIIKESREGSERVKEIVQTLRDFSHVDQSERKYADIHQGLDSTLKIAWNEIKYKATVIKEYGNIPEVFCYPRQLNQVFLNMIVNAAHAIKEKGEIRIKTWHDEQYVYIAISDTGCGIKPEHLNKIFEPFFTTKPVGKGTGLGLAMSYNIIKKHGGEILVESEPGKGSTFTIKLPIEPEQDVEKEKEADARQK